jgi:hypothetical protein
VRSLHPKPKSKFNRRSGFLTIRLAVTVGITGIITAHKNIINDPNRIADITDSIAVGISGFQRIGWIAADKNIIDYGYGVGDINNIIGVGVTADKRRLPDYDSYGHCVFANGGIGVS